MEENCERRCQCLGNAWVCTPMSCGPQDICKVQNGHLGCYPESTATCHIYGDPHYKTFDGKLYHFQGACNYTVTETCGNTSVSFTVTTRNEHRGNPTWTAINSVALKLEDVHIAVRKNNLVYVSYISLYGFASQCLFFYVNSYNHLGIVHSYVNHSFLRKYALSLFQFSAQSFQFMFCRWTMS